MSRLLSFFIVITTLFFSACSNPTTPTEVADTFLSALAEGDQKTARKYSTINTIKLLDIASTFGNVPVNPNFKFKGTKEDINGTTAIVSYVARDKSTKTLRLTKVDEAWKVDETKK